MQKSINVQKYNSAGTLVTYSVENKANGFELVKDGIPTKYPINNVEDGAITAVREYSSTEAFVGFVHGREKSTVVLYSLVSKNNLQTVKMEFPLDRIVNFGTNWAAICTYEEVGKSRVVVKSLLGGDSDKVQ